MDTAVAAPTSAPTQSTGTAAPSAPESKGTVGTQSTKSEATSAPEYHELKVNGKTVKYTKEQLYQKAQLGESAHERFEEAAKHKKEVEAIVGRFKTNPMEALLDPRLGLSKEQVRDAMEAWYTKEFIEPEQMSPEQLKLRDAEAKLKKYEDDERAKQKEVADKEFEALTLKERETLQTSITSALDKSGLPKTKFIVARMAFYMHKNMSNGWEAPMEVIIEQVKRERQSMLSDLTESSDAEALISYLGEDFVNKIRKHDIARLRAKKAGGVDPSNVINPRQSAQNKEEGPISYRDVNKNLRKLMQGK